MFANAQSATPGAMLNGRPSIDLSDGDFSNQMGPVAGSGGLYVTFGYLRVRTSDGNWVTKLAVFKQPRGDRLTVAVRFVTEAMAAQQFPVEFAQFRSTGENPHHGTPLSELPGMSMSQIGLLMIHGIRSIEDLVSTPTETINGMGLDAIQAKKVADHWASGKDAASDVLTSAKREAELEAKLAEAQRQIDQSNRLMAEMSGQIKLLQAMPQQGQQVPGMIANTALTIAVESQDPLNVRSASDPFLDGGGTANGNDDLSLDGGDDLPPDPLGGALKRGK